MKPFQGCYYLGAYRALSSVQDAFLLIHSVSGCSWGALALHQMGRADDVRQACTMMHENEIVFGGEDKLREALEILKAHAPGRVFVLNGCPSDMIHDDIQGCIDVADCPFPVRWMNTAGYCGSMRQGYIDAMRFLAGELPICAEKTPGPSVNLIGIAEDDFRSEADAESIRRMLEPKVRLNAMLPVLTEETMRGFSGAWLNVVFRGFEAVGEALKARLGMDYIAVDYTYGAEGSRSFLARIDTALGTDHGPEIEAGLAHAAESAKKALHPLRLIYQAEVAVAGDFMRAQAMSAFLRSELGLRISAEMDDRDPSADAGDWMEQVRRSGTVLAFGSSFQRQVEDEIPARLIRFSYPVMDAVALGYQPYAGFEGIDFLLSDIFNALLTLPYRRHGRFNP